MKIDWSPLVNELAKWRHEELHLPIWWRDDDAIAATPALDRLAALATDAQIPIHIAVIPDLLTPSLAPTIEAHPYLIPVIHGWRHMSHAPEGQKNAEFGHPRPEATEELVQALQKMRTHFSAQLVKLFVPPWNRISPDLLPVLVANNYTGISTFGPRKNAKTAQGLVQINTHIDPIFWRGDRGLVDPDTLVQGITKTLQDRRMGRTDIQEPLGLLTHHLVHTEDVWDFSRDVMRVLLDGGAVPADLSSIR
jgi:hypothetical protein